MWFRCLCRTSAPSRRRFGSGGNAGPERRGTRSCVRIHTLPWDVYHSKWGSFEKWKKGTYTNIGNVFFERRNEISVAVGDDGGRKEKKGQRGRRRLRDGFLFLFLFLFFSQGLKTHRKHWELPLCCLPPIFFPLHGGSFDLHVFFIFFSKVPAFIPTARAAREVWLCVTEQSPVGLRSRGWLASLCRGYHVRRRRRLRLRAKARHNLLV